MELRALVPPTPQGDWSRARSALVGCGSSGPGSPVTVQDFRLGSQAGLFKQNHLEMVSWAPWRRVLGRAQESGF